MKPYAFFTGTALLMLSRLGLEFGLLPLGVAAVATLLGLVAYAEVACDLARAFTDGESR